MDLRDSLNFLKRRGWLLVLAALLSGLAAFYFSKEMTPIYRATTTVLVNQTQSQGVIQYNDVLTSERLTATYAELVQRRPILAEVRRRLGISEDEAALAGKISVSPVRNTQLLRISVEDADPKRAADIANTAAQVFIDENAGQLGRPGTVSIAEQAFEPSIPVKPNIKLNTALAVILGLMVGGAIGFAMEYLDDTVKTSAEVEALTGLTTLGNVTRFRGPQQRAHPSGTVLAMGQEFIEDFRQIRTNIHFSMLNQGPRSILVTSCHPAEGKSTTSVNLAIVLAQAGHRVVLVDTDLRRPSLHGYFSAPNSFGLTGLLLSRSDNIDAALVDTGVRGLKLLPSGPLPPNPSEILMSQQLRKIMDAVCRRADYVILDSPPLMAVTDARLLAGYSDGTILVAQAGKTRSEVFQRGVEALGQANARIIGVVLNKLKAKPKSYYSYGYYQKAEQEAAAEDGKHQLRAS